MIMSVLNLCACMNVCGFTKILRANPITIINVIITSE